MITDGANFYTVRGARGAIVWGYREAAVVGGWFITNRTGKRLEWQLTAALARVDKFQLRQRPLLFTAPHSDGRGLWCWPLVAGSIAIDDRNLFATLGPPEQ